MASHDRASVYPEVGRIFTRTHTRSSWTVGLSPSSLESRSSHRGIRKGNTRPMTWKDFFENVMVHARRPGICLHPNQKSTSYHNRKSRSETRTSSIVMPPDFLCSFRSSESKSSSATTFSSRTVAASRFNPTTQVAVTADTMRDVWSDLTMTREPRLHKYRMMREDVEDGRSERVGG